MIPESRCRRRLLVLSCSARKRRVLGEVSAWELYDGVAFRTIRALMRKGAWPGDVDVIILSAEHGLIWPGRRLAAYDRRMTRERAWELAPCIQRQMCAIIGRGEYADVLVLGGCEYRRVLAPVECWKPAGVKVHLPEERIGRQLSLLKAWASGLWPGEPTGVGGGCGGEP